MQADGEDVPKDESAQQQMYGDDHGPNHSIGTQHAGGVMRSGCVEENDEGSQSEPGPIENAEFCPEAHLR